jgi:hypothetical protein
LPNITLCDRCWDHGIERKAIGLVANVITVKDKPVRYHDVGNLCKNCYLAYEEHIVGIRGELS